jgi:hypothetical protein
MSVPIEHEPFVSYKLDSEEKGDVFTIRLNKEERAMLEEDKKFLKQLKDGTAMKQLAEIGHFVLHDSLTGKVIQAILENKRKNERLGLAEV